jgi:hypothetical protein
MTLNYPALLHYLGPPLHAARLPWEVLKIRIFSLGTDAFCHPFMTLAGQKSAVLVDMVLEYIHATRVGCFSQTRQDVGNTILAQVRGAEKFFGGCVYGVQDGIPAVTLFCPFRCLFQLTGVRILLVIQIFHESSVPL